MLQNLSFWCEKNKANEINFHDGYYWTFNSTKALCTLFKFWSKGQISRILKSLEDNGLIKSGNYNKVTYDRTKWYAVTEKAFTEMNNSIYRNQEMELLESVNRVTENEKPIPDINTDEKPDLETQIYGDCTKKSKIYFTDEKLNQTFIDYLDMRKKIRKPATEKAIDLLIKKLNGLATLPFSDTVDSERAIQILEQSIENSWQGIFELKPTGNSKQGKSLAEQWGVKF